MLSSVNGWAGFDNCMGASGCVSLDGLFSSNCLFDRPGAGSGAFCVCPDWTGTARAGCISAVSIVLAPHISHLADPGGKLAPQARHTPNSGLGWGAGACSSFLVSVSFFPKIDLNPDAGCCFFLEPRSSILWRSA